MFLAMLSVSFSSFAVEQTICFSQKDTGTSIGNRHVYFAVLGDDEILNGGKCDGLKLADMNKKGWRLIQVVSGLQSGFGMVFEKVGK